MRVAIPLRGAGTRRQRRAPRGVRGGSASHRRGRRVDAVPVPSFGRGRPRLRRDGRLGCHLHPAGGAGVLRSPDRGRRARSHRRGGRRAPSSNNQQRRAFVVCTDREHLRELSAVGDYADHLAGAAAAVALVTPVAEEDWQREIDALDLGHAAQNMMLCAWELGIGSVHAAVYDERRAHDLLGLPEGQRCDYLLSFGYPRDPAELRRRSKAGGRRPLEELVHRERW
ncbi:MAG: nitroreductase family protein [Actinomycetota bacterium]